MIVRTVDLTETEVGADGLAALFAEGPSRLGALLLGDDDIERFVASDTFGRLATLHLFNVGLGPRAARAIAEAVNRLRSLSFAGGNYTKNAIGADGARALDTPHLARLEVLALGYNELGEGGVDALGKARHLRSLRSLGLTANDFSHDGFERLCVSDVLDTVETDANAMGALARVPAPALRRLVLCGNPIGDAGLRAILNAPLAARLERLNVVSTGLTDASVDALLGAREANPALEIDAGRNRFSQDGARRLAGR